jgi:succinoglycan biosynthesis protein ExoA
MLTPKPTPERPRRDDDRARNDGQAPAAGEPRSFAQAERRAPGSASLDGLLPSAWDRLEAGPVTRMADSASATPRPLTTEEASKRALIVIPCLNEEAVIRQVIQQVLDDDGLVDPLVLVADGGSTDRSRDIVSEIAARDPRVRLMANPRRLQSAGMNLAARAMGGERPWLVRVDAHADYPKNYASTLIAEARRTGADSVVVSMDTRGEGFFQRAVAVAQNSVLGTGGSAHRLASHGQWVDHGHHALFSLEAYQTIGGYDESFSHNEDAELDLRLAEQGGRIWLTDQVRIGYYPRSTPKALAKQYFSYGKGRARTVLKHYTPLKIRQTLPLAVAPAVASAALTPLLWVFAVPALVWMLAALSYGVLLGVKRRDPAAFLSGPAAMIMHLAWSGGFWAQLFTWRRDRKRGAPMRLATQGAP